MTTVTKAPGTYIPSQTKQKRRGPHKNQKTQLITYPAAGLATAKDARAFLGGISDGHLNKLITEGLLERVDPKVCAHKLIPWPQLHRLAMTPGFEAAAKQDLPCSSAPVTPK